MTGAVTDDNGVLVATSEDGGDYVAIGFRAKKSNGEYRYFWLYKVKFGVLSTSLNTKGDSISFNMPSIVGTVARRAKPDGADRHPWKAEADSDTVAKPIIDGWYGTVYEPSYDGMVA